ncbi:MAG TPA: protein kinase, partial [Polyangiaceae bacterium]|nr:protein kinase [Polyangiaceae bacterium]
MPTHIARIVRSGGAKEIVAATRIGRAGPLTVDEATEVSRTARLLMRSPHPNLAPVREVMVRDTDMLVVGAWVEGENLGELWAAARGKGLPLPLAVALRILLDVLSGLEALHSVRLAVGTPAGLVHGEVIPSNVIVGTNGVTRLIHAYRIASSWSQVPDATRYVAPEVLMRERGLDGRADVYSVGALLWEAMAGKPLMDGSAPAAVVKRLAAGPLPAAPVPRNAAWAEPLVPLVQRALSVDRDERFADAAAMRDALHAAVGSRVAPISDVARWVRQLAWTQIAGRTKRFADEPAPRVSEVDIEVVAPVPIVAIGTAPIPAAPLASPPQAALASPQPPPVIARRPPAPPEPKPL